MDLALYDPAFGYYARAAQRSGRAGDFFTSVDVGPVFGELLAVQFAELAELLGRDRSDGRFDLVEAGAGNGRLSADVLGALEAHHPDIYARAALHLTERSAHARAAQRETLGTLASRLATSSSEVPESFEGVLFANELLDAMPVHQVVMRDEGLKEIYVAAAAGQSAPQSEQRAAQSEGATPGRLVTVEGPPSTPALARYLANAGVVLESGWRAEISLAASAWVRDAARRLRRGFIILFDYGHDARELYSVTHSSGTLTTFSRHVATGAEAPPHAPSWLARAGEQDITAHVDFSTVQAVAHEEGLSTIGFLDQTYFLMGIVSSTGLNHLNPRALKTLLLPGGLGSTMKVLILGKNVGAPELMGCSFRVRVT